MEVIIRPTADAASRLAATLVANALRAKPDLVLGLATGRTMESVYARLADLHRNAGLDFSRCRTFNLDEYIGLPASDPHSYRHYMETHLFTQVAIPRERTHLPDGMAADLKAESARYERLIQDAGGIDLQLLGLGEAGHIGFNEPLSALRSRTREKALTPTTRRQNAALFDGGLETVPKRAITMGVGTILESKRCLLLATGAAKSAILAKAVEGPITSMITASALQLHARCTVICDEAAARRLKGKKYYRWIFENEPEWAEFRTTPGQRGSRAGRRRS
jgi:glucosamine-6-phosphate deaminase